MTSLAQQKRALEKGNRASRTGFCNAPHPNPKFQDTVLAPHPDGLKDQWGILVLVAAVHASVICNRFAGHSGDCAAYTFSISVPDTWAKPVDL